MALPAARIFATMRRSFQLRRNVPRNMQERTETIPVSQGTTAGGLPVLTRRTGIAAVAWRKRPTAAPRWRQGPKPQNPSPDAKPFARQLRDTGDATIEANDQLPKEHGFLKAEPCRHLLHPPSRDPYPNVATVSDPAR